MHKWNCNPSSIRQCLLTELGHVRNTSLVIMISQYVKTSIITVGTQAIIIAQLGEERDNEGPVDDEDDEAFIQPPPLKLRSYQEVVESLEDAYLCLESQGNIPEAMSIGSSIDDIVKLRILSSRQRPPYLTFIITAALCRPCSIIITYFFIYCFVVCFVTYLYSG